MNELQVTEYNEVRVLTTQQIAEAYGTDRKTISYNFNHNKSRYVEGKHFIKLEDDEKMKFINRLENHDGLKNAKVLYLWTEKGALLHAKSLNTDKAWEVYDYLVDNYFKKSSIPQTYRDALIETLRLLDEKEAIEKKNKVLIEDNERMKPKEIFADAVATSKTSILVGELAKILRQNGVETGQNRFFAWLRDNGYLIKREGADWNMPTQKSMNLGLFEVKERVINNPDGSVKIKKTAKVTGKGQQYFINKFLDVA